MPLLLDRPILVRPVVADRSVTVDREGIRTLRRAAAAVAVICAVVAVTMLVSDENHSESLTQSMTKDDVERMFKDTDERFVLPHDCPEFPDYTANFSFVEIFPFFVPQRILSKFYRMTKTKPKMP
jgi:hypothetical protein